jgi:DNA-binding SARP family transcriptional activator
LKVGSEVDIDLLGPLEARQGGVSVTPTAAKPRKLLALLALNAGQAVPKRTLFEELWGDFVPRYAHNSARTYILQLRNLIRAAPDHRHGRDRCDAKQVIVTCQGGYLLNPMGGRIDVCEFDRLAAVGHQAHTLGRFEAASRWFTEAMAVWRGRAFVDVQVGDVLEAEAHRLQEAWLNVLDRRIDADLRLGQHHELLGELAGMVSRHRTHEGMHAHFMVALYRSGRRCEAIDVYRRLRAVLVDQLGLEPSIRLQRLQQAILRSDSRLYEHTGELALALPAS